MEQEFMIAFDKVASKVNRIAKAKGWWEGDRNDAELIALMHSELSEALEYLRHGNGKSDHIPDVSGVEEELADVVIRIMDYAVVRRFDIARAIIQKIDFNDSREYRHGGKKF